MLKDVYIAGSVRTAIGAFGGGLGEMPASALGAAVVKETVNRSGVPGEAVDEVLIGNVIAAGTGPNVARQAAIGAGLSPGIPSYTINKLCGSGMKTVVLAAQAIQLGEADAIIAGGTESMSQAPYVLAKARTGYRLGDGTVHDAILLDALMDPFVQKHMGGCGDMLAERYGFTREMQDDFAIESYRRAQKAAAEGWLKKEIVPVDAPAGRQTVAIDTDEDPQRFREDKFRSLRPAFGREGTVTAGNASSIDDGAAAVTVLSKEKAEELGVTPQARIVAYAGFAREPEWFTMAPIGAIEKVLRATGWTVDEVDLFEINEAFSVVPMAAMKDLSIPHEKTNIHGGAVAMGHPVGCSGTRVIVTLIHALERTGGKKGIAALCIGGGMGIAMAIEMV